MGGFGGSITPGYYEKKPQMPTNNTDKSVTISSIRETIVNIRKSSGSIRNFTEAPSPGDA